MKNKFVVRLFGVIVLLSVIASAFFVAASASENNSLNKLNELSKNIYADDFLDTYVEGVSLTEAEKEYLRLKSGLLLTYSLNIPTSQVSVEYDNGTLTVTANEYIDLYSENRDLKWIPTQATVNGETKDFSKSPYTVQFFGLDATKGDSVTVKYSVDISISSEKINELINLSYNDAVRFDTEIQEKSAEYEELYSQYISSVESYEKYQADNKVYNQYLIEKRIYDEKNKEYLLYLEELAVYEDAKAKYDAYLIAKEQYYKDFADYMKFLNDLKLYNKKVAEHKQYEKKIAVVRKQLGVINATKTPITSLKRTVYSAIMGDTVTTVIENKGNIVEVFGANPTVVDMAGIATNNLRVLMKDYFAIAESNEEDRYKYYITNYETFRDNFVNLLIALDNLYLNEGVRGAMIAEEKHEKYLILVAQLYYIANALSDELISSYDGTYSFDSNYKIGMTYSSGKRVSPAKALENEKFVTDTNNAKPIEGGYPVEPIIPTYTPVEEPTMPTPVSCPAEIEPVSEPVEPTVVEKPEVVNRPGAKPQPYVAEDYVQKLVDAYHRGDIPKRADYSGTDVRLNFEISVIKVYVEADQVIVTYYDKEFDSTETQNTLYTIVIDKNSYADYVGAVPTKAENNEYTYSHCGWTDENGNVPNLACVSTDLNLYPRFEAIKKIYVDTWVVNGEEFDHDPGIPEMKMDGDFYYDFSGWKTEVDYELLKIIHTAVFEKPFVPTSEGASKISYENDSYVVEPSVDQEKLELGHLIDRVAGLGGIVVKNPSGQELSVSFSDVLSLKESGISSITLTEGSDAESYTYSVSLYDESGDAVQSNAKIGCKIPCTVTDLSHFVLYSLDDNGERKAVRYSYENGTLSFNATVGVAYYAITEYSLNTVQLDAVKILLEKSSAISGEKVSFNLDVVPGIKIDRVYYIDSTGAKIAIEGESFVMPNDDVMIGVDYTVEQYTVSFVSDGKTIITYSCEYGDTVSIPPSPNKAADGKYSYEFLGWSPEITTVVGDVVYTAVYSSTLLPPPPDNNNGITEGVLKLLLLAGVGLGCFVFIVIPSSVMTLVLIVKRKKRLLNRKKSR